MSSNSSGGRRWFQWQPKVWSDSARKPHPRRVRDRQPLLIEALEQRALLSVSPIIDIPPGAVNSDIPISTQATLAVTASAVQLVNNAGAIDLMWTGTAGIDQVQFKQLSPTSIRVTTLTENGVAINYVETFTGVTGRVIAMAATGDDTLDAAQLTTTQATLNGGAGNNTLYGGQAGDILIGGSNGAEGKQGRNTIVAGNGTNTIYGNDISGAEGSSGGNNLIIGGSGSDTIYGTYQSVHKKAGDHSNGGEGGQNLIVGGGGADTIYASQQADGAEGGKGSILIAGPTTLDQLALASILSEWTSTRSYADRIANLQGTGVGPRNNDGNFLTPGGTVFNDLAVDQLFGDIHGKPNWLLDTVGTDIAYRVKADDTVTTVERTTPTLTTRLVADGLELPIFATAAPGDQGRLFLAEQGTNNTTNKAKIKILDRATGQVSATPFVEFSDLEFNENMGLLGMAFSPNYATDGRFYVNVTARHSDNVTYNEIREYHVSSANPNVADPTSMRLIGAFPNLRGNHNAGWIGFSPQDGYLYMTRGDGMSGAGNGLPAQDVNSSLGKMLRFDVNNDDFPLDPDKNYAIPPTNPYVGQSGLDEIWALGLRNPFRASFDRLTGDLYIGDVGSNQYEEIDFQAALSPGGQNFGWPYFEGTLPNPNYPTATPPAAVDPIFTLQRPPGGGAAVIGGYVYRGQDIFGLQGTYFFSDYVNDQFYSFRYDGNAITDFMNRTAELTSNATFGAIFSFGEDAEGEIYIVDGIQGKVYEIVAVP